MARPLRHTGPPVDTRPADLVTFDPQQWAIDTGDPILRALAAAFGPATATTVIARTRWSAARRAWATTKGLTLSTAFPYVPRRTTPDPRSPHD